MFHGELGRDMKELLHSDRYVIGVSVRNGSGRKLVHKASMDSLQVQDSLQLELTVKFYVGNADFSKGTRGGGVNLVVEMSRLLKLGEPVG